MDDPPDDASAEVSRSPASSRSKRSSNRLNPHPEYGRIGWRKRAKHQLMVEPFCRMCAEEGVSVAATVADHVDPVGNDMRVFYYGRLQSLCKTHHDAAKKRIEHRGYDTRIGVDGYPVDPRHPFNRTGR